MKLSEQERCCLRQLAEQVRACSAAPENIERRERWFRHNAGEIVMPPVIVENFPIDQEIAKRLECESATGRYFELILKKLLVGFFEVGDDNVIDAEFVIPMKMKLFLFGIDLDGLRKYATDAAGNSSIAYSIEHPFTDLENDLRNLPPSYYRYDAESTEELRSEAENCFGDILQVKVKNLLWRWYMGLTARAVELMGMEPLFFAYMDTPELTDRLLRRIADDMLTMQLDQQEKGLLTLNNNNDFVGSGSRGFTRELPAKDFADKVRLCDQWGNFNSQESIGVSPEFYMEHIYPHYEYLAKRFGKTYYGCCEDVSLFYDAGLKNLPGLSKISISPWCNEEFMGNKLRGGKVIYSRKPSPNFLNEGPFDKEAYAQYIAKTLRHAEGCPLEFILRDIYELGGDFGKLSAAVQIIRKECNKIY